MAPLILAGLMFLALVPAQLAQAGAPAAPCEVSVDGRQLAREAEWIGIEASGARSDEVPYATVPDWQNSLRMQVGGLALADLNGDGRQDLVVGCYQSSSYPPYPDWYNMIYFNVGGELEAEPSWISADEVSTGDVQVARINADALPGRVLGQRRRGHVALGHLLGRPGRAGNGAWLDQRRARRRLDQLRPALRRRPRRRRGRHHGQPGQLARVALAAALRLHQRGGRPGQRARLAVRRVDDGELPGHGRPRRRRLGGSRRVQVGELRERHLRQ